MDNHYQDKYDEFIRNTFNSSLNFVFEVTKCCGYSTFISIYKQQTIIELYAKIIYHFGENNKIKDLFFVSTQNERIQIPVSNQLLSDFVSSHICCNPARLVPIYDLPKPVIYRLYFDDGCCNEINSQHLIVKYL
jgi:hypothetical protein